MKSSRSLLVAVALIAILAVALLWQKKDPARHPLSASPSTAPTSSAPSPVTIAPKLPDSSPAPSTSAGSPIADALNAPGGTIAADLKILQELFFAYQSNFPQTGNPVGENAEITAALLGDNPAKFVFIARTHRALSPRGELCDRWGTPFRFHQVSGTQMEVRSAGPDCKFGTPDDAQLSPEGGLVK